MIFTDGATRYDDSGHGNRSLLLNPTIDMASQDLVQACIVPFAVYYYDGYPFQRIGESVRAGCRGCLQLVKAANGQAFYPAKLLSQTAGISFAPMLYEFFSILHSEAVATVLAKGSGIKPLDIKSSREDLKVAGSDQVMIGNTVLGTTTRAPRPRAKDAREKTSGQHLAPNARWCPHLNSAINPSTCRGV